jgi:hypothetical protein
VRTPGKPLLALPAIATVALVPWTVGLATQLPHRAVAYHWNTAWTGLDVTIAIGLALTSWLSRRHDARAAIAAAATVTLMCTDVWFDLWTSAPGRPIAYAAAEAVAELVVAAACLLLGLHTLREVGGRIADDLCPGGGQRPAPAATDQSHPPQLPSGTERASA